MAHPSPRACELCKRSLGTIPARQQGGALLARMAEQSHVLVLPAPLNACRVLADRCPHVLASDSPSPRKADAHNQPTTLRGLAPGGQACLRAPKVPTRCAPRARVSKAPQIGHRARSLPAQIWGPQGGRVRARCPQSSRGHLPPALPATCTARGTCRPCAPRGWWWWRRRRRGAPALFAPRDGPPATLLLLLTGPPSPPLPGPTFWMVC